MLRRACCAVHAAPHAVVMCCARRVLEPPGPAWPEPSRTHCTACSEAFGQGIFCYLCPALAPPTASCWGRRRISQGRRALTAPLTIRPAPPCAELLWQLRPGRRLGGAQLCGAGRDDAAGGECCLGRGESCKKKMFFFPGLLAFSSLPWNASVLGRCCPQPMRGCSL